MNSKTTPPDDGTPNATPDGTPDIPPSSGGAPTSTHSSGDADDTPPISGGAPDLDTPSTSGNTPNLDTPSTSGGADDTPPSSGGAPTSPPPSGGAADAPDSADAPEGADDTPPTSGGADDTPDSADAPEGGHETIPTIGDVPDAPDEPAFPNRTHGLRPNDGRSNARLHAVQLLFGLEFTQEDAAQHLEDHLAGGPDGLPSRLDRKLLTTLTLGVAAERDAIDAQLAPLLDRRSRARTIEPLLRTLLRAGAWELLHRAGTDTPVILDEYVALAHALGLESGAQVLNAVLKSLATSRP